MWPAVNAGLNFIALVLLLAGFVLIKRKQVAAHKWTMLSALGVSGVFLASYLGYHYTVGRVEFQGPTAAKWVYYPLLLTHSVLAASVPFLAGATIWAAFAENWARHRRLAWITFPIWVYVSFTGVLVYFMLYQWFPSAATGTLLGSV